MSCRLTALSVFFLLFLLRVQSIDLTHARSLSYLSAFDLPEIDGSAVDDTCTIFSEPNPTPETENTPPPLTPTQAVATPEKPAVQTPSKDTGTPTRPQPAPPGPITNSQSDLVAHLFSYLLTNSRRLDSWNSFFSKPVAGLPYQRYGVTSESDELAPMWLKNTNGYRWKTGFFSSDDSSDES